MWTFASFTYTCTGLLSTFVCCCSCLTSWTAGRQAFVTSTISQSLLKFMSIESVMLSNQLILCCPLLLWPLVFPSIRVFSIKLAFQIRWSNYWSFSISPSSEYSGLISFRIDCFDLLQSKRLSRVWSSTTVWSINSSVFSAQPSLWSNSQHL